MRWTFLFLLVALPHCVGCSDAKKGPGEALVRTKIAGDAAPKPGEGRQDEAAKEFVANQALGAPNAQGQPEKQPEQKAKEKPRKIRYTADLRVIVDDFEKSWEGLKAAMKDANTEPAHEDINTSPGSPRSGTWRIRVPVDLLESFRTAIIKLGDVERNTLQSEDMTAQFYDLEAHVANRNAERDALRELLKEVGKKDIKHYLEVKRELDSITDDINRKEGQLRLWKNLTDLTTVTVHLREKQKFIPEERAKDQEVATFGMRAGKTWSDSWDLLLGFCQLMMLVAIAIAPWLPIPLVVLGSVWLIAKLMARADRKPAVLEAVEVVDEPNKNA